MSQITRIPLEPDTGVCILVVGDDPNTLGLIAPKGSLAIDRTTGTHYISNDSSTSDWLTVTAA